MVDVRYRHHLKLVKRKGAASFQRKDGRLCSRPFGATLSRVKLRKELERPRVIPRPFRPLPCVFQFSALQVAQSTNSAEFRDFRIIWPSLLHYFCQHFGHCLQELPLVIHPLNLGNCCHGTPPYKLCALFIPHLGYFVNLAYT